MSVENGYLTDEELEQLILEVEQYELVAAPPGLADVISMKVEDIEWKNSQNEIVEVLQKDVTNSQEKQKISRERQIKEFHKYCIRVVTSAAAAIALVFTLPNAESPHRSSREIPARIEVVGECFSREEVLSDTSFLTKVVNGLNSKIGGLLDETEKEK